MTAVPANRFVFTAPWQLPDANKVIPPAAPSTPTVASVLNIGVTSGIVSSQKQPSQNPAPLMPGAITRGVPPERGHAQTVRSGERNRPKSPKDPGQEPR